MTRQTPPQIDADWLKAPTLQTLFDVLETTPGTVRVVGGAVRNTLMGLPVEEVDLATTLLPEEVMARIDARGGKAVATGIEHGTVTAVFDHDAYEVTTLREDIETDGRRAVVKFGDDWTKDAERRDFTINALYCDRRGKISDPVGGYQDILERNIRFIGNPGERIREDGLRILRFFRFFAHYGSGRPDADGLKACAASVEMLDNLSSERVWMEMKRLLMARDPGRALLWMRTTNVLKRILPETDKWGIDTIPLLVDLETAWKMEPDPLQRLMAMIRPDKKVTSGLAERLTLSNAETARLTDWAETKLPDPEISVTELDKILYRSSPTGLVDVLTLNAAKLVHEDAYTWKKLKALAKYARRWKRPEMPVRGRDLVALGFEPGPALGEKIAKLEEKWIASGFKLGKEELLSQIG